MTARGKKPTDPPAPGVIESGAIYTLPEVQHRLGLGFKGLRTLRERGLPVIRLGRAGYVSGTQLVAFMEGLAVENEL